MKANKKSSSPQGEQSNKLEKKLNKREKKLQERLQEAHSVQASAEERLRRAEARLQKRVARVERIESRLAHLQQQIAEPAIIADDSSQPEDAPQEGVVEHNAVDAVQEGDINAQQDESSIGQQFVQDESPVAEPEETSFVAQAAMTPGASDAATELAHQARAAAEAAEQAAREASRRASAVADRLEQRGSEPHVMQEGLPSGEKKSYGFSTMEVGSIVDIEEEEEMVAAVAAMMIADVAGAVAAEAEALAEASSARTREARHAALEADQVLEEIRTAIANGALTATEAERFLQHAEREATRTHARLADAEAAEEQARRAAMNAEAEAEVAEGMAFAANNQLERDSDQRSLLIVEDVADDDPSNTNWDLDDGTRITAKLPRLQIHPQETGHSE